MFQPMQQEAAFPRVRERLENPSPSVHLQTSVPLLLHAETVLGREEGKGNDRAVTLNGDLHLPELRAEIGFEDGQGRIDAKGSRAIDSDGPGVDSWAVATIVPHLFTLAIPLQYFAPPAREESDVWALTREPSLDPGWVEHYAGQLQEAPFTFHQHVQVDTGFDLTFTLQECMDGRGAQVEVAGELRFERPLKVRLLYRDPEQSMSIPSEIGGDHVEVVVAGTRVPIPPQTVSGLAARRSGMTVRIIDAEDRVVCVARSLAGPAGRAA